MVGRNPCASHAAEPDDETSAVLDRGKEIDVDSMTVHGDIVSNWNATLMNLGGWANEVRRHRRKSVETDRACRARKAALAIQRQQLKVLRTFDPRRIFFRDRLLSFLPVPCLKIWHCEQCGGAAGNLVHLIKDL